METPRAFHVYSAYLEAGSSQDTHAVCTAAWKRGGHLLGPQGGCLPTAQLTAKSGWSVYTTQEGCFKLECTQHPREHAKGTHSQGLAPSGISLCWPGTRPGKLHHDQQAQQALQQVFREHRLNKASLDHSPPWGLRSQTQMLPPSAYPL